MILIGFRFEDGITIMVNFVNDRFTVRAGAWIWVDTGVRTMVRSSTIHVLTFIFLIAWVTFLYKVTKVAIILKLLLTTILSTPR